MVIEVLVNIINSIYEFMTVEYEAMGVHFSLWDVLVFTTIASVTFWAVSRLIDTDE